MDNTVIILLCISDPPWSFRVWKTEYLDLLHLIPNSISGLDQLEKQNKPWQVSISKVHYLFYTLFHPRFQTTKIVPTQPGGTSDNHNSLPWSSWVTKVLFPKDHFRITNSPGLDKCMHLEALEPTQNEVPHFLPFNCSYLTYSHFLFLQL